MALPERLGQAWDAHFRQAGPISVWIPVEAVQSYLVRRDTSWSETRDTRHEVRVTFSKPGSMRTFDSLLDTSEIGADIGGPLLDGDRDEFWGFQQNRYVHLPVQGDTIWDLITALALEVEDKMEALSRGMGS